MQSWIAINLQDFHRPEKAWQRGKECSVEVKVVGAKTLERAKETAQCGNNDPWMVFNISQTKNIIYAKLEAEKKEDPERELREMWTEKGISKEKQDEIIREVEEKAKPGAMVGPFKISE